MHIIILILIAIFVAYFNWMQKQIAANQKNAQTPYTPTFGNDPYQSAQRPALPPSAPYQQADNVQWPPPASTTAPQWPQQPLPPGYNRPVGYPPKQPSYYPSTGNSAPPQPASQQRPPVVQWPPVQQRTQESYAPKEKAEYAVNPGISPGNEIPQGAQQLNNLEAQAAVQRQSNVNSADNQLKKWLANKDPILAAIIANEIFGAPKSRNHY